MKKLLDTLKIQLRDVLQTSKVTWHQSDDSVEHDIQDLREILQHIKNENIKFQSNDRCRDKISINQDKTCEDAQKDVPKKRGRKPKTSTSSTDSKGRFDTSESKSLDDSTASSSSRSRRAAAQAAGPKMARVQSLVQLKTKLRRPTNFNEKQVKAVSSPPAKCRRTHRNQSAGSSSSQTDEINEGIVDETKNKVVVNSENLFEECLNVECSVFVEKLNTPTIKSFTHLKSRSSRSLDRASKRKTEDLFNDSISVLNSKSQAPNSDPTHKSLSKKSISKKDLDSGISSTEEELQQLMKANLPIAQSSPILLEPFDCEFKGFDDQPQTNKTDGQTALFRDDTFVVGANTEKTQVLSNKTIRAGSQESSCEELEATETVVVKSKTKVLRKKGTQSIVEEKENLDRNNETHIITNKSDASENLRSRTKVLKKATDHTDKDVCNENNHQRDSESVSSPETRTRARTKTIKKHEQHLEMKSDSEIAGKSVHSQTKTIKKNNDKDDHSDSTEDESSNIRSRTKTIKKGASKLENNILDSEFKDNPTSNKINKFSPLSPAPAKGELVKKRVEDFEKMQNGTEESEEEKTAVRVTRNAIKSKVTVSATEAQNTKQARNIPVAKLQASGVKQPLTSERPRMTPLGVNNRMTPASDSAHKSQANKWTNSTNRPNPVETNTFTLINKQAIEEAEKKRKEEEILRRQAKEEEAKRKKEKNLKATADEVKRKRVEKLQKVAATREAAEKEKERLAAKAEKDKEVKMRQIAIEKEKQKEEQLRKKHLMQQKTLEHEERRKYEEAARLAKLKEQEEEHNRMLAMKEREQELLKQQKAELRLAEAEKIKHQGGKLGKIAAVNNAKLKMQQGMTPTDKSNGAQSSNCYEITPAREDRPLLPPKTETDYGIDDAHSGDSSEDESQPKKMIPAWAQPNNREPLLMVNKYIPKKLWCMFMECDPCPDVNKMFAGNPIKRRIRTSSAVWRTPPKYSRIAP